MSKRSAFCASYSARLLHSLRILLAVFLLSVTAKAGAQSTPIQEIQVSTEDIVDFEFDWGRDGVNCPTCNYGEGNARLIFSDRDHNMWLGYVDPQTGAFVPENGRAVLVDTRVAFATEFGNGPEWMFSTRGSEIVYTKYFPGRKMNTFTASIAIASWDAGYWLAGIVEGGLKKQSPIATLDLDSPDPRINYQNFAKTQVYWRVADDPSTETLIPIFNQVGSGSRRWVPGKHKIVFSAPAEPDVNGDIYQQVFIYDTDTDELEQLTFDPVTKWGAIMWRAPEFGNHYVFITVSGRTSLTIWRVLPDENGVNRWQNIKTVAMPESMPYVWSPESFVHNGRSYVFFQVSSNQNVTDMSTPTQLAMTGIIPSISDFRMLTNDSSVRRVRMDPEYYITAEGPSVYYNRYIPSTSTRPVVNDGVWRIDTGLGPPIAAAGGLYYDDNEYGDKIANSGTVSRSSPGVHARDGGETAQTASLDAPTPEMTLHQNHPNPFNRATTVSFMLRERTPVTLSVFDVEGRLVRMLADGDAEEGFTERIWDGNDENGHRVSSGIYFYRLTVGSQTLTRKMVLVR